MKTVRELLLARHAAASVKLDAVRRQVVQELNLQETPAQSGIRNVLFLPLYCAKTLWRELILPSRRIWSGLATVWILIFAINFAERDTTANNAGNSVAGSGMALNWQTQQRLMNELLADRILPPDADRPRNKPAKPRTEMVKAMAA